MEKKSKHLEFIQDVINRMARNSFMLKSWAVTLIAGIFALASRDSNKVYFLVAYLPIIMFWCLDSFYLFQERIYRALYDRIRQLKEEDIDYSMKPSSEDLQSEGVSYAGCFLSKTEIMFYLPLAIVSAVVIILSCITMK